MEDNPLTQITLITVLILTLSFSALLCCESSYAIDAAVDFGSTVGPTRVANEENVPSPQKGTNCSAASWSIAIDNDSLVSSTRDEDYTAGFAIMHSGDTVRNAWYSLDTPLDAINRLSRVDKLWRGSNDTHGFEFGIYGFTPNAINSREAINDDRPYASLLYATSVRQHVNSNAAVAWQSSLSVGVLGLSVIGDVQNGVHRAINRRRAEGWSHQISAGGEPTLRYTVARQNRLRTNRESVHLKSSYQASLGYITEASISLNVRAGRLSSPWWSFNPEFSSYGEKSMTFAGTQSRAAERFFWAGVALKGRAYNAFLQGQFRHSDVTYTAGDLNHLLLEAWLGYTVAWSNGYRMSYMVRGHSSEVEQGKGNRRLLWGGLVFSKTFD
ncbi:MAG: lipid A deacylase LpxR family protein [Pseudomonadales bacterium]